MKPPSPTIREADRADHIGSGLSVSHGRGCNSRQEPSAFPLPNGKWRAEISGVENGVVTRSWIGPDFPRRHQALEAARSALALAQPKADQGGE